MKSVTYLVVFIVLTIATTCQAWNGKCVQVQDGDTVEIEKITLLGLLLKKPHKASQVRLWGIDCPEKGQDLASLAKSFTKGFVEGKLVKVNVTDQGKDRNGRVVAEVFVDGLSLNEALLKQGLASWGKRYAPTCQRFKKAQEAAKKQNIGIWRIPNHPCIHN